MKSDEELATWLTIREAEIINEKTTTGKALAGRKRDALNPVE